MAKTARVHNPWVVMALVSMAQFVVVVDATITNVALPSMQRALNISPENLQWIITAYTLAFGGFLMLGGRAADILGRKRVFIIGVLAFALASFAVGVSQTESIVIVARGIQGFAAAFMSPAALSIVLNTFKEGKERNKALGVWGAITSSGAAIGLLAGGALTQYLNWRWNFFVNVPIALLVAALSIRFLPESRADLGHKQFDVFGAVTVTGGLMLLVYALTKAPVWGWADPWTLGLLATALVILGAFLYNEHRSQHPLVPLSIFTTKNVGKANLVMFPMIAAMFAMFFFLTLYVQNVLGYEPFKTGLAFFPVAIVIGIVATISANLVIKIGYKPLLVAGPFLVGAGLFWLGFIPVHGEYLTDILPSLVIVAAGMGMSFVGGTIGATNGVAPKDSGLASGLFSTTGQVGGALGLAILSAVATSATASAIKDAVASGTAPNPVNALVDGFHAAFFVGAGLGLLGTLIALFWIHQPKGEKIDATLTPGG